MEAVSELHCPRCGWRGLVAAPQPVAPELAGTEVGAPEVASRRGALVWRHVRAEHRLASDEAELLLRTILHGGEFAPTSGQTTA